MDVKNRFTINKTKKFVWRNRKVITLVVVYAVAHHQGVKSQALTGLDKNLLHLGKFINDSLSRGDIHLHGFDGEVRRLVVQKL